MYRLSHVDPRGEPDSYRLTPRQNPFVWGCVASLLIAFVLTFTISLLQEILQGGAFSVWTFWALVTGLVLLVGVPVHIGEYSGSKRTVASIEAFEIAISDAVVGVGHPFTVTYTLSFKQPTTLKHVRLSCICLTDWGVEEDSSGPLAGFRREIRVATYRAIRPRDRVRGEPGSPLVQTFSWTLPAKRFPRRASFVGERKAWHLRVFITAHRGRTMRGSFFLPVQILAGTRRTSPL